MCLRCIKIMSNERLKASKIVYVPNKAFCGEVLEPSDAAGQYRHSDAMTGALLSASDKSDGVIHGNSSAMCDQLCAWHKHAASNK